MHKQLKFNTTWFKKDKKEKGLKYTITDHEEYYKDIPTNLAINNNEMTSDSYVSANQYYS